MSLRARATALLFFLAMSLAGGLGLAAMTGALSAWAPSALKAEIVLADYPIPAGFGVAPQEVSDFLVAQLQERVLNDIALRLLMGNDNQWRKLSIRARCNCERLQPASRGAEMAGARCISGDRDSQCRVPEW